MPGTSTSSYPTQGLHAVTRSSLYGTYEYDVTATRPSRGRRDNHLHGRRPAPADSGLRAASFAYDDFGRVEKRDLVSGELVMYVDEFHEKRKTGTAEDQLALHPRPGGRRRAGDPTGNNFSPGTERTRYMHPDHLGSVEMVTCGSGESTSTCPGGPGRRAQILRSIRQSPPARRTSTCRRHSASPRRAAASLGFTGHEHDFAQGLINMRGRVYDPTTAKFLTADPIVADPFNLMDFNRYAYVRGNPVRYVDPSGFQTDDPNCPPGTDNIFCIEERRKREEQKLQECLQNPGGCSLDEDERRRLEEMGCSLAQNAFGN